MTKNEKVLAMITKLQQLNEQELDILTNAVNACIVVQSLQKPVKAEKVGA